MRQGWMTVGWFLGWLPLVCYHEYGLFGISANHYIYVWAGASFLGICLAGVLDIRLALTKHSGQRYAS